jgi:DNA-directed RNA polymerase
MFKPEDYLLAFANLLINKVDNNVYKTLNTPAAFFKEYSWPVYEILYETITAGDTSLYDELLVNCEYIISHFNSSMRGKLTNLVSCVGLDFINATSLKHDSWLLEQGRVSNIAKASIGFILINPLLEGENRLKLLALDLHILGKDEREYKVRFLEEAYIKLAEERLELVYSARLPSLEAPKDWSSPKEHGMIKSMASVNSIGSVSSYRANNILQQTAWRINHRIVNVVKISGRLGRDFQFNLRQDLYNQYSKEKARLEKNFFSKNKAIPSEEYGPFKELQQHYYDTRDSLSGRDISFVGLLSTVKRFSNEKEFYFKYTNDFRGRIYPSSIYMSPQGSDLEKAVIEFAKPVTVTPRVRYWQEWNLASLIADPTSVEEDCDLSLDKLLPDDRVMWVKKNWGCLESIAKDPINRTEWHSWEKPYLALAQLLEMVFSPNETRQPIAVDATCSGLQFLAAMGGDEQVGKAVNLTDTKTREDVYLFVAGILKTKLAQHPFWGNSKFDINLWRKLVKRCVMVFGYAGTRYGMGEIVYEDGKDLLKKKFPDDPNISNLSRKNSITLGNLIYDSLPTVLPKPEAIMRFITTATTRLLTKRIEDEKITEPAKLALSWVSPSGFRVNQYLEKYTATSILFPFGSPVLTHEVRRGKVYKSLAQNSVRLSLVLANGKTFNKKSMSSSAAPNFVHSYDAALVVKTCIAMETNSPLTNSSFCHDSFGVSADRVDELNIEVRKQFIKIFSTGLNTIESFAIENGITRELFTLTEKEEQSLGRRGKDLKEAQDALYAIYDNALSQGTLNINEVAFNPFFFS